MAWAQILRACPAVLLAVASVLAASPVQSPPMPTMTADARAELAPGGRLRAALNLSNTLLVSARSPQPAGVAPDLARELARRANAAVEFVGYANAGLVADAVVQGAWDVAFIGDEPARASAIAFSPAYVEIESTYLVPAGSPLRTVADVDRDGVRIATTARAAYTLYLQRSLRHARLVETDGIQGSVDLFVRDKLDALAGLKPRLLESAASMPGAQVLEGRFTAVQQSMGVPKSRAAAAAYLAAFAAEIRTSGLLASLIARHDVRGLTIAGAMP